MHLIFVFESVMIIKGGSYNLWKRLKRYMHSTFLNRHTTFS